jgi:hypothetical protein
MQVTKDTNPDSYREFKLSVRPPINIGAAFYFAVLLEMHAANFLV